MASNGTWTRVGTRVLKISAMGGRKGDGTGPEDEGPEDDVGPADDVGPVDDVGPEDDMGPEDDA